MKQSHFPITSRIILIIVIVLLTRIDGLAQSSSSLTAHYVEIAPATDGISYNVSVYFSAMDSGYPINNLKPEGLFVQEDGQKVEIQSLHQLTEEPINVVLVLDTSAAMSVSDMKNAKFAASTFISRLKPNDQIALITFDSSAKNQTDELTKDHKNVLEIINNKIVETRETDTCLYDAVYSALQMFASQPVGTRSVIVLTNGKDQRGPKEKCSDHSSGEVLDAASKGELRAPLFMIGLEVDEKSDDGKENLATLQSFADKTGGMYKNLLNSSQFANIFDNLSTQFRAQYILSYVSTSAPGEHNITVGLNLAEPSTPSNRDTRKFSLEPLPPQIVFTSPQEDEAVGDVLKIGINLITQGDAVVERVAFEVNGLKEGEDDTKPYEIELDARKYPVGLMTISVTAYGSNNIELARTSVNTTHVEAAVTVIAISITQDGPVLATPAPVTPSADTNSMIYTATALSMLAIFAIGFLIFILLRQQRLASVRDLEKLIDGDRTLPAMQDIPIYHKIEEHRNTTGPETEPDALGALTIEASDDSTLVGHRFIITASLVTLGRSADNDVCFPADKPVSRHHAEIYQISGNLYIREVQIADASGAAKPPKYGTFLNQKPMGPEPVQLKTGDEIQLGKRVRLKFESYTQDKNGDALTYDEDDDNIRTAANDIDQTAVQD